MLKEKLKKIIATVLLGGMFLTIPVAVMANEIMPCWLYVVEAENDFSITGTTATVDCRVTGDYGEATKAKVIAELQLESGTDNWIAYGTWVDTQNDYEASVYETKSVTKGHTYRVKATYTVWEGSQSETVIIYSDEITA